MSKRRYQIGLHEPYDFEFDKLSMRSPVLNPSRSTSETAWVAAAMQTRTGLESLVQIFAGDASFTWSHSGETRASYLVAAEAALSEIQGRFETIQKRRMDEGLPPLPDMPNDLLEKRLRAEAAVDVTQRELAAINARLATLHEADEKRNDLAILKDGPVGRGHVDNGRLTVIDGQTVARDNAGLLRIKDERSPYDGLPAAIYHERIVMPWTRAYAKSKRAHAKARSTGDAATMKRRPPRPPLPPWPQDIRRFDWETGSEIPLGTADHGAD